MATKQYLEYPWFYLDSDKEVRQYESASDIPYRNKNPIAVKSEIIGGYELVIMFSPYGYKVVENEAINICCFQVLTFVVTSNRIEQQTSPMFAKTYKDALWYFNNLCETLEREQ